MGGSAVRARKAARAQRRAEAKRAAAAEEIQPTAPPVRKLSPWLLGPLLVIAVVLAYQPAWTAGYIWDDDLYLTHNPLITAADGWSRIWFSFDAPSQYFPLTYSSFRLEHAVWDFNAAGYHWVNILLHATNALLLWRLLRSLGVPAAWFAAALFALHPVQVESVAWITERKNILMGLFFLSSLIAWVRFIDDGNRRPVLWFASSFLLYLLALSAKTTACTLPAALVLILWWKHKPLTIRRWLQIAPFVLAGIAGGLISILWERAHQGGRFDFIAIGSVERLLIGARAVWFYLSKLAWPADLIFSYPRWDISRADLLDYVWLIALAALLGAIVYARRRLGRGPEVAFVFFVATLSPLLGVVIVSTFQYSFVADHYQYLACIGPLALFAAGTAQLVRRPLAPYGAAVILCVLAFVTWRQTTMYRNEESLWLRTIAQNPGSWLARNSLAVYWLGQKRFDEAIEQTREIIELRPDDPLGHMNLGAALARKGDTAGAIVAYERARALRPNDPRIQRNLGQALLTERRVDDAITHLERALELRSGGRDPRGERPDLELELGNAYLQKGGTITAVAHYRKALELRPNFGAAHMNLGSALLQQGAFDEARQHFEKAKELDPALEQNADVYVNAGNAALQKRDVENAILNYRQALAIRPNFAEAHSNLGTAYLFQGNFAAAIREFETTLTLAPRSAPTLNNLARLLATAPEPSLRHPDRAVQLAQQAIELTDGRDPVSYRALALAQAEKGDFGAAEKAADQAITIATVNNPAFAEVVRKEKEAYARGQRPSGR